MKTLICVSVLSVIVLVSSADAALVEHWAFDDAPGSLLTPGDNGFDGVVANGATFTGAGGGFDGVGGAAVYTGGLVEWIKPPTNTVHSITQAVTVAYWAKGDDDMPLRNYMFAAHGPGWNMQILIPDNVNDPNGLLVWGAGASFLATPATPATSGDGQLTEYKNQWNHWAFTADDSTGDMKMYLNGKLLISTNDPALSLDASGTSLFSIGNHPFGQAPFKGLLDDMYIFDTALTVQEIRNLPGVPAPGPGDFDFDDEVDGADFLFWQRDMTVGSLSDWEDNYGTSAGAIQITTVVPEPSTCGLMVALWIGVASSCRRRP